MFVPDPVTVLDCVLDRVFELARRVAVGAGGVEDVEVGIEIEDAEDEAEEVGVVVTVETGTAGLTADELVAAELGAASVEVTVTGPAAATEEEVAAAEEDAGAKG